MKVKSGSQDLIQAGVQTEGDGDDVDDFRDIQLEVVIEIIIVINSLFCYI